MKKFFALVILTCAFVPAIQGMENFSEPKNLKRSCDVIDLTNDAMDPLVTKKQKTEENNAVVSNGLAKKIVYGAPVVKKTTLYFYPEYKSQFVHATPKKLKNKPFKCFNCETSFLNEKNLVAHQTFSYCGKKTLLEKAKKEEQNKKNS